MAGTAETVRALVREDPEMEAAIETVLERADSEDEIDWADVNDDLTSGQWGRLIEKGVLVDDGDGFVVSDAEGVRDGLEDEEDADKPDGASWTKWDKVAAAIALSLFPGYYFNPVRNAVGGVVDVIFGPLEAQLPFYAVILVMAVLTGFNSTVFQANLMNMEKMSYYQEQMKEIQERQEAAKERGDDEALEEIRQEQIENAGENLGMFKEQLRPMGWIMLLTVPIFLWMYWLMNQGGVGSESFVLPLVGQTTFQSGTGMLPFPSWIVWYFLCSMSVTQVIRKALNVQTQPT